MAAPPVFAKEEEQPKVETNKEPVDEITGDTTIEETTVEEVKIDEEADEEAGEEIDDGNTQQEDNEANDFANHTGDADDPFEIYTPEDLKAVADNVNTDGETFESKCFKLMNNISLEQYSNWTPIGYGTNNVFKGSFDGNGFEIRGLNINLAGNGVGLFGAVENSVFANLTLVGPTISSNSNTGSLVGVSTGDLTLDNISIKDPVLKGRVAVDRLGGIAGRVEYGVHNKISITNCHVENVNINAPVGKSVAIGGLIGGIISKTGSNNQELGAIIEVSNNSVNKGSVFARGERVAGLLGGIDTRTSNGSTIVLADNTTDVTVTTKDGGDYYYVGGMVGFIWINLFSSNNNATISNCHSYGDVLSSGYYVGGLAGFLEVYDDAVYNKNNSILVENSSAHGDIVGTSYYNGGLIGFMHNGVTVRGCFATGDVTGTLHRNGGLVGYSYGYRGGDVKAGICLIENSYATGNVYSKSYSNGGFIGFSDNTTIRNCFSTGRVESTDSHNGGFIGHIYSSGILKDTDILIENCFATGTVKGRGNGFIGTVDGTAKFTASNNYFDTTTTKKSSGGGKGTGISARTTTEMIDISSYDASWNMKDNRRGRAAGSGDDTSPWYIDDDITYPYLCYQYDGKSQEEVNYNLGSTLYSFSDGSVTDKNLGQRRADFTVPTAGTNVQTFFQVSTAGARGVYFPYTPTKHEFPQGSKTIKVPGDDIFTVTNDVTPYSLGGSSATNIVSFDPLPYAEKSSDRKVYVKGDESTYTKRGDLIEYHISLTNPSIRYEWLDINLTDALPEGLTLVEGFYNENQYDLKVLITDTNGNTAEEVLLNGTPNEAGRYYSYSKDQTLEIHLGDLRVMSQDTGIMPKMEVVFTAITDRRAVSTFPLDTPENIEKNGDNIRNMGTTSGTIREVEDPSNEFAYDIDFDDNNVDPVYDAYKVSYMANEGESTWGEASYDFYYFYDENYKVLDNDNNPFLFTRKYYNFENEWLSRPKKGSGEVWTYKIGDTYGLTNNGMTVDSKYREASDMQDIILEDYYGKTDYKLYASWKIKKGSLTIIKKGDDGHYLENAKFTLESLDDDTKYEGKTDENGRLVFGKEGEEDTLPFGEYKLTEVESPKGYELMKESMVITIPLEKQSDVDPGDSYDEHYDDVYVYYDLTYTLTNVAQFELPKAGGIGQTSFYILLGMAMVLIGSGAYRAYTKK